MAGRRVSAEALTWSAEDYEKLREMWADPALSKRDIWSRLGRTEAALENAAKRRKLPLKRVGWEEHKRQRCIVVKAPLCRPVEIVVQRPKPPPLAAGSYMRVVPFVDAHPVRTCQWPMDTAPCAQEVLRGKPYCAAHWRRAHTQPQQDSTNADCRAAG